MNLLPDDLSDIYQAGAGAVIGYFAILVAVRLVGLRSFAKMASHDFAVTVAIGSVLAASAMAGSTPLIIPLVAIGSLFALQFVMSFFLSRSGAFSTLVQNEPILLMDGKTILYDNLKSSDISEEELRAKLREANVTNLDQILAVVFESTGDVSVLHAEAGDELEDWLILGVRR